MQKEIIERLLTSKIKYHTEARERKQVKLNKREAEIKELNEGIVKHDIELIKHREALKSIIENDGSENNFIQELKEEIPEMPKIVYSLEIEEMFTTNKGLQITPIEATEIVAKKHNVIYKKYFQIVRMRVYSQLQIFTGEGILKKSGMTYSIQDGWKL